MNFWATTSFYQLRTKDKFSSRTKRVPAKRTTTCPWATQAPTRKVTYTVDSNDSTGTSGLEAILPLQSLTMTTTMPMIDISQSMCSVCQWTQVTTISRAAPRSLLNSLMSTITSRMKCWTIKGLTVTMMWAYLMVGPLEVPPRLTMISWYWIKVSSNKKNRLIKWLNNDCRTTTTDTSQTANSTKLNIKSWNLL